MSIVLLCLCQGLSLAQDPASKGQLGGDYYMMPSFGNGTVYFVNGAPATGKMNICAVDQSLRYLDDKGEELQASGIENVLKVVIDGVTFLHQEDFFYRLYPVGADLYVALKREVRILHGAREGAYGEVSQTIATKEYRAINVNGTSYKLKDGIEIPHDTRDTYYVYKDNKFYPVNKNGLRKVFPEKKAEVDAYFKSAHFAPKSLEGITSFLEKFMN